TTSTPATEPTNTPNDQATPTLVLHATPTGKPTIVVTPTLALPTATLLTGGKASPTPTETVISKPTATSIPTIEPFLPSPTLTPVPPVLPAPTSPPVTPTSSLVGPGLSPTPTATFTATVQSTQTPLSPIPPTLIPPTETPTPTDTPEPTQPPAPTPTEPITASVCDLVIDSVTAECAGTCASWTATISNTGDGLVEVEWVAELELKVGSGGFQVVDTTSGTVSIDAGSEAQVSAPFCYDFPPNARQFRVRVHLVTGSAPCNIPARMSPAVNACNTK
ncbi:MAG: hypothetical protein ABIQ44_12400, partial [Chloroflexia bacterium]